MAVSGQLHAPAVLLKVKVHWHSPDRSVAVLGIVDMNTLPDTCQSPSP